MHSAIRVAIFPREEFELGTLRNRVTELGGIVGGKSCLCLGLFLVASVYGCGHKQTRPATETLSYKTYEFEKKGISRDQQAAAFARDSKECLTAAENQYIVNLSNAEKLSAVYGKKPGKEEFSALKDAHFVECMTGSISKDASNSKGWALK
ncbi:MAG: hypothetical protein ACR2RB_12260 [Gammaproteobacteria bacterium]